eukprot:scaffold326276_cov63-Tisochrysis_lutea.AAC.1
MKLNQREHERKGVNEPHARRVNVTRGELLIDSLYRAHTISRGTREEKREGVDDAVERGGVRVAQGGVAKLVMGPVARCPPQRAALVGEARDDAEAEAGGPVALEGGVRA